MTVTVVPAGPPDALSPVTRGLRSTTSNMPALSDDRPATSAMSQTRVTWLLAPTAAGAPVTYIAPPLSARTRPYCCIARATTCACGPMPPMAALTAAVALSRSRAPYGSRSDAADPPATCEPG